MVNESRKIFILFVTVLLAEQIPGAFATIRLEFTGSTEFPSLKCILKPRQYEIDIRNKTLCFCVWIQYVIPTWNCIKGDGKVTMEDLKDLIETIRNTTKEITTRKGNATPPKNTAKKVQKPRRDEEEILTPLKLPQAQEEIKPKLPMMLPSVTVVDSQKDDDDDADKSESVEDDKNTG